MSEIARDGAAFSTVIVRESGRSSIPETSAAETIRRGVMDAPHARGMTAKDIVSALNSAGPIRLELAAKSAMGCARFVEARRIPA